MSNGAVSGIVVVGRLPVQAVSDLGAEGTAGGHRPHDEDGRVPPDVYRGYTWVVGRTTTFAHMRSVAVLELPTMGFTWERRGGGLGRGKAPRADGWDQVHDGKTLGHDSEEPAIHCCPAVQDVWMGQAHTVHAMYAQQNR